MGAFCLAMGSTLGSANRKWVVQLWRLWTWRNFGRQASTMSSLKIEGLITDSTARRFAPS